MKKIIKIIMSSLLALALLLPVSGCGEKEDKYIYSGQVGEISQKIEKIRGNGNISDPSDEQDYQNLLSTVEELSELFEQLIKLETPEHYTSAQKYFSSAWAEMTSAHSQFKRIDFTQIPLDSDVSAAYTNALQTYFSAIESYNLGVLESQKLESAS